MEVGELLYDSSTTKQKIEKKLENFKENFELDHEEYRKVMMNQVAHITMYNSRETIYLFYNVNWKQIREQAAYDDERFKLFKIKHNLTNR